MASETEIWDAVLDAAWQSFLGGDGGIGAAVTNAAGAIIAVGGNRTGSGAPDELAGSPIAHAETVALQQVAGTDAAKGTMWTSLQPCLMCFGAAQWAEVSTCRFLVPDPRWPISRASDRDEEAAIAEPDYEQAEPAGERAVFAALLAFSVFAEVLDPRGYAFYERRFPRLAARAKDLHETGALRREAGRGADWRAVMAAFAPLGLASEIDDVPSG
ncbi:MAG: nucleoside deaminase [Pacificimonas sp.]|nr:nucleoside deaminase [Pacificimonas sp.]